MAVKLLNNVIQIKFREKPHNSTGAILLLFSAGDGLLPTCRNMHLVQFCSTTGKTTLHHQHGPTFETLES